MFASLDVLSGGRMICGVGVGWLEKEFDILGVPLCRPRPPMTDEFLAIFNALWTEEEPDYQGKYYQIDGIYFEPKPLQQPRIPIWVGGHTRTRAAAHREIRRLLAHHTANSGFRRAEPAVSASANRTGQAGIRPT